CAAWAMSVSAQTERMYRCELGLQGGCGYYVGDATEYVFQDVREAYGLHFRYKFDQRWALQVKGLAHHIKGQFTADEAEMVRHGDRTSFQASEDATIIGQPWETQMVNVDVVGEFNFFRFGVRQYDERIKPITPYIGVGIGIGMCMEPNWAWRGYSPVVQVYVPFVVGVKWKIADRWQLQAAWQHNVYFADNLEGIDELNNAHNLNGRNFLNNDVTSQLTVGIVFEFAQDRKICALCE
ncbi:MAG: DUF6089 family protein, partial [Paludibacteraceae bacterium]